MILFSNNLWIISIRQAFLNLLPYFIMIGLTILTYQMLSIVNLTNNHYYKINEKILNLYTFCTPLVISTSIAYFLSKNFELNRIFVPNVNFLLFIYFYWEYKDINTINININLNFLMIIIPILTVFIYRKLYKIANRYLKVENISDEVKSVLLSIIPFLMTFAISLIIISLFFKAVIFVVNFEYILSLIYIPIEILGLLNLIISGFIWWLTGIHGTNLIASFFGEDYLKQTLIGNINADIFINNFVMHGGHGSTLALIT